MTRDVPSLDNKDLRIIRALDSRGPDATMRELSRLLGIPSRTLRFRLSRLRSNGYLRQFRYSTREKRIGLGENIIIMETAPSSNPFPVEFFEKTQAVGWYTATYGRINGFLANVVYPLEDPDANKRVLEQLRAAGLISAYKIFDLFSYRTKGWDLSKFDSEGRWTWDWQKWHQQIDSIIDSGTGGVGVDDELETQISFDGKDVVLLRMLHENPDTTQKEMAQRLNLPLSQVRRRLQQLREEEVIVGYKPVFTPFRDTLTLMCFIESTSAVEQILGCLHQLPYTLDVYTESSSSIAIRIRLSTSDIVGFLQGLDRLHHLADSFSVQILHKAVSFGSVHLYDLFDADEHRWNTHSPEYLRWLEQWLSSQTRQS